VSFPKILLLSRGTLRERLPELQEYLGLVAVEMAVAHNPEDAEEAKKVSPVVAFFNKPVAIVADFPGDLVVNEDGSIEPILLTRTEAPETNLVVLAE